MKNPDQLSRADVLRLLAEPGVRLLDVRDVNAYNGWTLRGEGPGGHMEGARSLAAKWADYIDWIEVVRSKGVVPADHVILYGSDGALVDKVARRFVEFGYPEVSLYADFIGDWQAGNALPLTSLSRYRQLVPASWLWDVIERGAADGETATRTVIVHAHYRNRDAYLGGHIPTAIDMDTLDLESPETWNRRTPAELAAALCAHGIDADTRVVLYGKYLSPDNADEFPGSAAGQLGAMRCALIMLYAGVKDVRVLKGGYQAWLDAGYEISRDDVPKAAVTRFGVDIPLRPEFIVDMDEARRMIRDPGAAIVSVRSWPEFIGKVSGYNYIQRAGRIPGALWGNCGSDAYHMENYRNLDHTMREADEIEQNWAQAGVVKEKKLAFFCGTGWRGSEAFFSAYLMGWPRIAVYDGGWFEWSNHPENPIETGEPRSAPHGGARAT